MLFIRFTSLISAHKTIQATLRPNYLKISSTRPQMACLSNLLSRSLVLLFHPIATIVLRSFNTKAITTAARKTMTMISTLITTQDAPSLATVTTIFSVLTSVSTSLALFD